MATRRGVAAPWLAHARGFLSRRTYKPRKLTLADSGLHRTPALESRRSRNNAKHAPRGSFCGKGGEGEGMGGLAMNSQPMEDRSKGCRSKNCCTAGSIRNTFCMLGHLREQIVILRVTLK
eukprot:884215-Prorocentrum_minimum.AAC.1